MRGQREGEREREREREKGGKAEAMNAMLARKAGKGSALHAIPPLRRTEEEEEGRKDDELIPL